MSMHPSFADWYRSAGVTFPVDQLSKRWAGIEALTKKPSSASIVGWAKLFISSKATDADVPPGFHDAFKAEDETFPLRDNMQELRVLAGAALRNCVEQDRLAKLAASALVCGSFGERKRGLPTLEHLDVCEKFLSQNGREVREPNSVKTSPITKSRIAELLPSSLFTQAFSEAQAPFTAIVNEISGRVNAAYDAIDALTHRVHVREEELNILWWLQTLFSRHLKQEFSKIGQKVGSLVFPTELAEMTVFLPGPPSALAVLVKALEHSDAKGAVTELRLIDAINSAPREWRERVNADVDVSAISYLCPISLAIKKSLETDGPDDWLPVYKKVSDVSLSKSFNSLDVARQVYRERLLIRQFVGEK